MKSKISTQNWQSSCFPLVGGAGSICVILSSSKVVLVKLNSILLPCAFSIPYVNAIAIPPFI